jgi:hypothetical protein
MKMRGNEVWPVTEEAEATPDKTVIQTVPCAMCREPIDPLAKVCKHCKADLTWRHHLPVSSTTLAIATALIAVIAAVAPQIQKLFETPKSKIRGSLIATIRGEVMWKPGVALLVNNAGSRIGAVLDAYVLTPVTDAPVDPLQLKFYLFVNRGTFVEPSNAVRMDASFDGEPDLIDMEKTPNRRVRDKREAQAILDLTFDGSARCRLILEVANSDSTTEEIASDFKCEPFAEQLRDARNRITDLYETLGKRQPPRNL